VTDSCVTVFLQALAVIAVSYATERHPLIGVSFFLFFPRPDNIFFPLCQAVMRPLEPPSTRRFASSVSYEKVRFSTPLMPRFFFPFFPYSLVPRSRDPRHLPPFFFMLNLGASRATYFEPLPFPLFRAKSFRRFSLLNVRLFLLPWSGRDSGTAFTFFPFGTGSSSPFVLVAY